MKWQDEPDDGFTVQRFELAAGRASWRRRIWRSGRAFDRRVWRAVRGVYGDPPCEVVCRRPWSPGSRRDAQMAAVLLDEPDPPAAWSRHGRGPGRWVP